MSRIRFRVGFELTVILSFKAVCVCLRNAIAAVFIPAMDILFTLLQWLMQYRWLIEYLITWWFSS